MIVVVSAIDANIQHPADYAGVAGALPEQNFIIVRGDQGCPAAPDAHSPPPVRCDINPEPSITRLP